MISIIVPVFNEEMNIDRVVEVVSKLMSTNNITYEILFMDNSSTDNTFAIIKKQSSINEHVRGIRYSRNFGYQRSIYKGFLEAKGDCVVQLDCDLQDDPSLILEFYKFWKEGYKVVNGVRIDRDESIFMKKLRSIYYKLVNLLSEDDLVENVGEFRLLDRVVVERLRDVGDHQAYLRGLISQLGFKTKNYPYSRNKRVAGESKFNFKELIKIALDGIFNHSVIPLRIATLVGLIISVIVTFLSIFYILGKIFWGQDWPQGFTTLAILILLGIGLNSLFLGVIGEYLGRIYKQVKKQPIAIIEETTDESN